MTIEYLRKLLTEYADKQTSVDRLRCIEKELDEDLEKYRDFANALKWYADKNHYNEDGVPYTNNSVFGITYDEGSIARKVLSE